ncbi:hypothetical protein MON38_11810 [Hymenobacter sp. DH14]|uniref:Curlin n=1 Tax=Hymenobacter cyanobacteriorum TaxID=2926463 RepID=A0A9X1VJE1_9BACT|nr:hypothetical protein [Hymenobacter cyanobacteriorum]MCI1188105.1 hypothetical protein [Hymenobacter cyanobacteriorum]
MKTLQKLTLMAFAILSAGAANAQTQCNNCTPPTIVQPPVGQRPPCPSCGTTTTFDAAARLASIGSQPLPNVSTINSSSVYQRGTNQFACVEQVLGDNVATLVQDAGSTTAIGRNDAYQSQYNPGFTDNQMYGAQTGNNNLLVQRQHGVGNYARAEQSGNRNIGAQSQGDAATGDSNTSYAMLQQSSSDNVAVQYQRGTTNLSDVAQYNIGGNWSTTTQLGSNNSVVVNQH